MGRLPATRSVTHKPPREWKQRTNRTVHHYNWINLDSDDDELISPAPTQTLNHVQPPLVPYPDTSPEEVPNTPQIPTHIPVSNNSLYTNTSTTYAATVNLGTDSVNLGTDSGNIHIRRHNVDRHLLELLEEINSFVPHLPMSAAPCDGVNPNTNKTPPAEQPTRKRRFKRRASIPKDLFCSDSESEDAPPNNSKDNENNNHSEYKEKNSPAHLKEKNSPALQDTKRKNSPTHFTLIDDDDDDFAAPTRPLAHRRSKRLSKETENSILATTNAKKTKTARDIVEEQLFGNKLPAKNVRSPKRNRTRKYQTDGRENMKRHSEKQATKRNPVKTRGKKKRVVIQSKKDFMFWLQMRHKPKLLSKVVHRLSDEQKKWIVNTGFESLLHFRMRSYPQSLGYYLVYHFNSTTCSLQVADNRHIPITEDDVHEILGLPKGPKRVHIVDDTSGRKKWRKQYKNRYIEPHNVKEVARQVKRTSDVNRNITVKEVARQIKRTNDVNRNFKLNFLIMLNSILFQPSTNAYVRQDIIGFTGDINKCSDYNWCEFLLHYLRIASRACLINPKKHYFTASLIFLVYFYMDRVVPTTRPALRKQPTFMQWTDRKLMDRQNQDMLHGTFGKGRIAEPLRNKQGESDSSFKEETWDISDYTSTSSSDSEEVDQKLPNPDDPEVNNVQADTAFRNHTNDAYKGIPQDLDFLCFPQLDDDTDESNPEIEEGFDDKVEEDDDEVLHNSTPDKPSKKNTEQFIQDSILPHLDTELNVQKEDHAHQMTNEDELIEHIIQNLNKGLNAQNESPENISEQDSCNALLDLLIDYEQLQNKVLHNLFEAREKFGTNALLPQVETKFVYLNNLANKYFQKKKLENCSQEANVVKETIITQTPHTPHNQQSTNQFFQILQTQDYSYFTSQDWRMIDNLCVSRSKSHVSSFTVLNHVTNTSGKLTSKLDHAEKENTTEELGPEWFPNFDLIDFPEEDEKKERSPVLQKINIASNVIERPRRQTKPSDKLKSPFHDRACFINYNKVTKEENDIWQWLHADTKRRNRILFRFHQLRCLKFHFQSFKEDKHIHTSVIDTWSCFLNSMEKLKANESPKRFYCYTDTTNGTFNATTPAQIRMKCENFAENLDLVMNTYGVSISDINLLFFPIHKVNHYYLVCYNLKNPSLDIIDNIASDESITTLYGTWVANLHTYLVEYLRQNSYGKLADIERLQPTRIKFHWQTKNNYNDCGIFTMRHMQTYMGGGARGWTAGLQSESDIQQKQLDRLRVQYCHQILTSDLNSYKNTILTEVDEEKARQATRK